MIEGLDLLERQSTKIKNFVIDKIFHPLDIHFDTNSLIAWLSYYYKVHVKGAPEKTEGAKKNDLSKFINFFQREVGHDHIDNWTPAVTKQFQKSLCNIISDKTRKP